MRSGDPRPLRLLVGSGSESAHLFSLHNLDDLGSCTPIPTGATTIHLTQSNRVRCLRLDNIDSRREFLGLRTDAHEGGFLTAGAAPDRAVCDRTSDVFVMEKVVSCSSRDGSSTAYLVLFGNEVAQTITLVRVPAALTNTKAPRVAGVAKVGRVVRADKGGGLLSPLGLNIAGPWAASSSAALRGRS